MYKADKNQLLYSQSQRNLQIMSPFKLKLQNSNHRLTKFRSTKKLNCLSGQRYKTSMTKNTQFANLMKTFFHHKPKINNKIRFIKSNMSEQQEKTRQFSEGNCRVLLNSTDYLISVTNTDNFINILKDNRKDIITFSTQGRDLRLDYWLTKKNYDLHFLKGTTINLKPVIKTQVKTVTLNSFQVLTCIGTGGFSKVFLCRFIEDGEFYAMKVINKQFIVKNKKKKIVMNQRNIMKQLNHPFIIKMKFAFETAESLIFILQYCPGGELFNLVKKFKRMKEDMAKFYIIQILLGLEKIHQENIVYRDFKPENILIDINGHVRIADFGLAKPHMDTSNHRAMSFCGSPEYMPPEMIMKTGHSFPVDFYCLGALIYELLTGLPPFYSKDPNKIYEATICETLTFPNHTKLSPAIKDLLMGLLNKDQRYRIGSLKGVKQVLAHPWFGKIDKNSYLNQDIEAPVSFNKISQLNFSFEQLKQNNLSLVSEIRRQQRESNRRFSKVMTDFYFDYRSLNQQINVQKCLSISRSKDKHKIINFITQRSQTTKNKFRMPFSLDVQMAPKFDI